MDAANVPRLRLFKGMAHRNSLQTYFMCRSKNFRHVHASVWMGEVVHQAKQTVEEILKTFLRWGGILSPQLILLREPMIFSKENLSLNYDLPRFQSSKRFH